MRRRACYAQEEWVSAQGYQDEPWPPLVNLRRFYHPHLARVSGRACGRRPTADR